MQFYKLAKGRLQKSVIFSDIVQKVGGGSGSNHYFRAFRNNAVEKLW